MWQSVEKGGTTFNVYKQQHGESCGPSSVLMLMRQIDNTLTAEAMVRLWFKQIEGTMKSSGQDPGGKKAGSDARIFDFSGGTRVVTIIQVLNAKRSSYGAAAGTRMKDFTLEKPGIVRIGWPKVGGHFVVCLGNALMDSSTHQRIRVYLDPWYGLVMNRHDIYPHYDTTSGSFGLGAATGKITHLITTNPS